jgi:hypothetical protein
MIQSPKGMPKLKARIVSVWAMGRKKTKEHRENNER